MRSNFTTDITNTVSSAYNSVVTYINTPSAPASANTGPGVMTAAYNSVVSYISPAPAANPQPAAAANPAPTPAAPAPSAISSAYSSVVTFFSKSPEPPAAEATPDLDDDPDLQQKNGRLRIDYSKNITASIELSEKPKRKKVEPKPKPPEPPVSTFDSIYSTVSSLFSNPATALRPPMKKADPPEYINNDVIREKMIWLEAECNKPENEPHLDDLNLQKVELIEYEIKEHAARRVDLFFYQVIAAYNKKALISEEDTVKQHGKGTKIRGSHACHSAQFCNLRFDIIPVEKPWLVPQVIWDKLQLERKPPSFSGTHFEDSLNMTIELPPVVNQFDKHIEGMYGRSNLMKYCLRILNKVSMGKMDPKTAMTKYIKKMHQFFNHFEEKYVKTGKIEYPKTFAKIWEYEKAGTFSSANKEMTAIDDDYIYLMLRLKPDEIAKAKKDPAKLFEYYQRIQDEIFTIPKPEPAPDTAANMKKPL